jgi:hypothetical protein
MEIHEVKKIHGEKENHDVKQAYAVTANRTVTSYTPIPG